MKYSVKFGRFVLLLCLCAATKGFTQQAFRPVFTNMTEVGVSLGRVISGPQQTQLIQNRTTFTAQTFNGVQLRPRLALGATVGVDWYASALLMPISASARYDLMFKPQNNIRVFSSLDVGYGVAWLHRDLADVTTTGGWYASPGIGLRLGKMNNGNFTLAFGYKRQEAYVKKSLDNFYLRRDENRIYNRITFRMGVAF